MQLRGGGGQDLFLSLIHILLFGLDDTTMALANPSYAGSTPGYEANSLENNYFIRTGDILEWSDPVADQILQKLNQKVTSFKAVSYTHLDVYKRQMPTFEEDLIPRSSMMSWARSSTKSGMESLIFRAAKMMLARPG